MKETVTRKYHLTPEDIKRIVATHLNETGATGVMCDSAKYHFDIDSDQNRDFHPNSVSSTPYVSFEFKGLTITVEDVSDTDSQSNANE